MFSIDLLNGKGLPEKINIKVFACKVLLILIPVMAVPGFAWVYQCDSELLQHRQQILLGKQQELKSCSEYLDKYKQQQAKLAGMNKCITDITQCLKYRIQISDVLQELATLLSDNIFIYEMSITRNSVQKQMEDKSGNAKQCVIVCRHLNLILCGYNADQSDAEVQLYINALKKSPLLTSVFTQIKPSARHHDQLDEKDTIFYEIECTFKKQGLL